MSTEDDEYDFSGVAAADMLLSQWRAQSDDDDDDDDTSYFWPDQLPYDIDEKLREINRLHTEDQTPVESSRPRAVQFNNRVQMRAISMRKLQSEHEEDNERFDLNQYETGEDSVADNEINIRPTQSSPRAPPSRGALPQPSSAAPSALARPLPATASGARSLTTGASAPAVSAAVQPRTAVATTPAPRPAPHAHPSPASNPGPPPTGTSAPTAVQPRAAAPASPAPRPAVHTPPSRRPAPHEHGQALPFQSPTVASRAPSSQQYPSRSPAPSPGRAATNTSGPLHYKHAPARLAARSPADGRQKTTAGHGRPGFSSSQNSQLFSDCISADGDGELALTDECLSVLSLTDDEPDRSEYVPMHAPDTSSGNPPPPSPNQELTEQFLSSSNLSLSLSSKVRLGSEEAAEVLPAMQPFQTSIASESKPLDFPGADDITDYSSGWHQLEPETQPPPWLPITKPVAEPLLEMHVVPTATAVIPEPTPELRSLQTQTDGNHSAVDNGSSIRSTSMPNLAVRCVAVSTASPSATPQQSQETVSSSVDSGRVSCSEGDGRTDQSEQHLPASAQIKLPRAGSAEGSSSGRSDDSAVESMDSRASGSDASVQDKPGQPAAAGQLAVLNYLQQQSAVTAQTPPQSDRTVQSALQSDGRTHTFNTRSKTAECKPRGKAHTSGSPTKRAVPQLPSGAADSRLLQRPRSAPVRIITAPAAVVAAAATSDGIAVARRTGEKVATSARARQTIHRPAPRSNSAGRQVAAASCPSNVVAPPSAAGCGRQQRIDVGAAGSAERALSFQQWLAKHEKQRQRADQRQRASAKMRRQEADIKKEQGPMAFRCWLRKKRQQKRVEQRLHCLQHQEMLATMERQHTAQVISRREAYREWMQRKQREKERAVSAPVRPHATLRCLANLYTRHPGAPEVAAAAAAGPDPAPAGRHPHHEYWADGRRGRQHRHHQQQQQTQQPDLQRIYAPHGDRCRRSRSAHVTGS